MRSFPDWNKKSKKKNIEGALILLPPFVPSLPGAVNVVFTLRRHPPHRWSRWGRPSRPEIRNHIFSDRETRWSPSSSDDLPIPEAKKNQINALMASSLILPIESFHATIFPLVYATKTIASGTVDAFRELSKIAAPPDSSSVEKLVGISNVVSHHLPFLSSLDPPLVFEVGINMLSLADISGGKPEWASGINHRDPHPLGSVGVLICQRKHREGRRHESPPSRS